MITSKQVIQLLEENRVLPFGKAIVGSDVMQDLREYYRGLICSKFKGASLLEYGLLLDQFFNEQRTFEEIWEFHFVHFKDFVMDFFEPVEGLINRTLKSTEKEESFIKYSIPWLNEMLGGIFKETFTVFGADTGCGKSEILSQTAIQACMEGKKVVYFDFENDDADFILRRVYAETAIQRNKPFSKIDQIKENNPDDFYQNLARITDSIKGLLTVYNNKKVLNIHEFLNFLYQLEDQNFDLIVVDHLHYFDFITKQSQHEQITEVMMKLRDVTKNRKIPVICASHLKQRTTKKTPPDNYDLFGSSNIAKIAKNVVLLSKDDEKNTLIQITKNRDGQSLGEIKATFNPLSREFLVKDPQIGFSQSDFSI